MPEYVDPRSWHSVRMPDAFLKRVENWEWIPKKRLKFGNAFQNIMIFRVSQQQIERKLKDRKVLIILGPRQAGKSTLLEQLNEKWEQPVLWWNGDEADIRKQLAEPTSTLLRAMIGNARTLIIDEAQRIENIGLCLKLIHDNIKDVKLVATGSSAFELANRVNEPLTGRKWEFFLYPLSYGEMALAHGPLNEKRLLQHRLVYGYYPEIVTNPGNEEERLKQLANSYLYKDILTWERVLKPDKLEKLVQALAFQVGNEVSYHELGQLSGLDNHTVEKYIQLLEKAFIVFRLGALNRNLRTELKKSRKIYFYDNGLRNAVINQFQPFSLRNDVGALWENFLITERMKYLAYNGIQVNKYFWRTLSQQEIDYVEEVNGRMEASEFKWSPDKKGKFPKSFLDAYPGTTTATIHSENFESFINPASGAAE
jgi:predicted AAA+ superfamily ATPase